MKHLKKILALVLVMAMTFTMLPVFAAADDVAVETVAPVAEAPAAEAPAAESAPVAVEDVGIPVPGDGVFPEIQRPGALHTHENIPGRRLQEAGERLVLRKFSELTVTHRDLLPSPSRGVRGRILRPKHRFARSRDPPS